MGKLVPQPHGGALYHADKGETQNPNGAPKRTLQFVNDELIKEGYEPVTKGQVEEAYLLVVNLSEDELKRAVANQKNPMIVRIVGKELLKGKGFDVLERMLDRAHGKAIQKLAGADGETLPMNINVYFQQPNGHSITTEVTADLPAETI